MTEIRLICPDCGDAIQHHCQPKPLAQVDAILAHDAQFAHMSESRSKSSTKDGRSTYNQNYPEEFLVFWNIYPKHRDKRKALKAWRNATRRATVYELNAGAIRYRNDPNRLDEYTKYAEGWLNGDGWEDEPLSARSDARPYDNAQAIYDETQGGRNGQRPSPDHRGLGAGLLPGPETP